MLNVVVGVFCDVFGVVSGSTFVEDGFRVLVG